jgi:hypothetical protein
MPAVTASPSPSSKSQIPAPKNKLKTVLGLGTVFKDPEASVPPLSSRRGHRYLTRQSVDTTRNFRQRRKHRAERSSISDSSFFIVPPSDTIPSDRNAEPKNNMNSKSLNARPNRRHPLRLDAQDGPWSVSVAETPHRALSYNLYIKSELFDPSYLALSSVVIFCVAKRPCVILFIFLLKSWSASDLVQTLQPQPTTSHSLGLRWKSSNFTINSARPIQAPRFHRLLLICHLFLRLHPSVNPRFSTPSLDWLPQRLPSRVATRGI